MRRLLRVEQALDARLTRIEDLDQMRRRSADGLSRRAGRSTTFLLTEIEEHFRKARGTGLFLLSPGLGPDRVLEGLRSSLEAVLQGIDLAFTNGGRVEARTMVNSLAFCAQAVVEEAERMVGGATMRYRLSGRAVQLSRRWRGISAVSPEVRAQTSALEGVVETLEECIRNCETHYRDLKHWSKG
jgi:hypothetical protein